MAFTNPSNITDMGRILPYVNEVMDSAFGILFLFAIFTVFFISLKEYPTPKAFAAAAFITVPFAVFFYIISIINTYFLILFVVLTIVGYLMIRE